MEKISKVYQYVDGTNDLPFPNATNQLEIKEFTYDAKRMGGAPTISASVKYPTCLDDEWTGKEYVDFRGEKYVIKQTPSSSYSNEDNRYKHDVTFVSERIILDNTYFYDVVTDPTDVDKYVSNSSKVIFFGDIHEFAKRLDYSLKYSKVGYTVVVDEGISTGGFTMSFEDQFFSQVLQSIFDIYGIPYYFVGKVIHIGYTNNAITRTFKYGVDDALLSINKTNANYKIVNRITGAGSPDNIPYYYPNPSEDRAAIEAAGGKWITPSDKLMPPIYRESLGAERFYNAENGTYKDPITGEYYIFENEYVDGNPKEHKVAFDHIKPTIKEMVNAAGLRIDMFEAFDYDANDNDDTDEEGKYIHPYFFGKLRKIDGANGFNLFAHAIEEDEMVISMTSGSCGACNFVIGVDDDTQKNPVQVHTNGELLRDKDGNVIRSGRPQPAQQDTLNNSVWIALRKDEQTFGVLMPNATNNYKPNALTDTFVILHIDLPQAYITSAENKLKEEVIKYMATNNSDKFNFSINFSRIFFAENLDILSQLNENARLQIEYNKKLYELYISSYSYKMSSNEPLPQITVELSDTLTINKGTLQTSIDAVKQDIMSSIGGSVDFLKQGLKYFVRKDVKDYAKFVDFREGIDVGGFESLISGGTFRKDIDGKSYIEVDRLYVRLKAIFENLEIKRTTYVGGEQIASPAAMKCIKVEDKGTFYRCYYLNEQEGRKIENEFAIGDQAICKEANLETGSNQSNQYYWRLVVEAGDGYIDLSKADCDTGSTVPAAGDDIVQLGNRNDVTRQKAIIQSTVSLDAPSIKLLAGINSFSLEGKAIISMGFDSLTGKATFNVYGNAYIGNPDGSSFIKYTPEGGVEINAKLSIGTTIGDGNETVIDKINQAKQDAIEASGKELTDYAATVTKDIEGLQNQMDGAIETWFEDPVPTLTNKPAVDWTTVELKNQHLGDLYYSAEGKAYRFQMNGTAYVWQVLSDSDITKALAEAKKAQDTADGKRKVFVRQPFNTEDYEVGDLWVNATFATIYKNDLLRCKTAKAANVAFNIVHWELASKYTDDTKALEAAVAAANAQATADAAQDASDVVAGNVSDLNDYVDGAFKDGLITEAEAQAIATYINTINNNKQSADNQYSKLYANVYLAGTAKTNLASSKTALDTATTNLISSINAAIKDGKTTVAEKEDVDAKFALYNTANATFSTRIEEANKAIQDKLKTYSDEASAAAAAAAVTAGNAQKSANEANAAVGSLNTYIDGAFKDGVVSEAEAAAIEKYINSVNNTKSEVKATFDKLYANVYLSGTAKTDLNAKYTALNSSITNLLASINTAIADGKTTTAEKTDVDAKFALFNTAYAAFSTAIETANKAIQDKLKDYSDAASEAASNAQNSANTAQSSANKANNLLSDIASDSKLTASEKQETKKEWDIIVSEKAKNDASADFYGVSKTAYGTAYTALNTYITPLLASLTTTSNIVGTTFRSTFKTYYDARTDLLNTIAKKAKQLADAAQSSANQAIKDIAGYSYIAEALKQPATEIQNGLILSSLVSLGYKPSTTTPFKVMSGINGIYDAKKPGNGISYWAGGDMKDLAEDFPLPWQPNNPPKPSDPSKYAKSVVRMDGTVYFAGGNMWIDVDGKIHCDPLSFFVGSDQVGDILTLFTPVTTGAGSAKKVVGARQNHPFEDGTGKGRLMIGKHILSEDANGYLSLTKNDGTPANFYTSGGFSALGLSPDIGGGGGSGSGVYSIFLGSVEYPSSDGVVKLPAYPVVTSLTWANITNKPSWIGATKPSYSWTEIGSKPSWIGSSKPSYDFSELTGYTLGSLLTYKADANTLYVNNKLTSYNNIYPDSPNLFPANNNANGIIDVPTHISYSHQLGFSNYGAFYHRVRTANTWSSWREISYVDWIKKTFVNLTTAQTIDGVKTFNSNPYFKSGAYFGTSNNGILHATGGITAVSFTKSGGNSTQLLRADGGVATIGWQGQAGQPKWVLGAKGQHDYEVWDPSVFRVLNSRELFIRDIRGTTPTPNEKPHYTMTSWFSNTGTPDKDWWSSISVHGWGDNYEVWELAGPATASNTQRNLHYRSGVGTTWNAWRTILDSSNYAGIADSRYVKKSGDTMTGLLTAPTLDVNQPGETLIRYRSSSNTKTATGWNSSYGSYLYNYQSAKYLGISDSGTPHFHGNILWHAANDGSGSGLDADLLDGLHLHTGRNNEANKVVRTDGSGYIQAGYINISNGHEKNASSPTYVWGANSTDGYVRSYQTSKLSVAYSSNSDMLDGHHRHDLYQGKDVWMTSTVGLNAILDLSSSTYNQDTFYPCTGTSMSAKGLNLIKVTVQLNSGTKPTWSTHTHGFTCNMEIHALASGWGVTNSYTYADVYDYGFTKKQPCGYSQMNNSSTPVLWLRGGGKYFVRTDYNCSWTIRTSAYTASSQTISPQVGGTAPFEFNRSGIYAAFFGELYGNAASATKLQTARTINGTSFDGTANIVTSYWGTARTLSAGTDCSGSVSVNGSGNFTLPITVNTATKLRTSRTIWGQSFNGTANVSGALTGVSTISASGRITTSSDIYSSGWLRTEGSSGWYSETHGGGIHMTDGTWVRIYNGKQFYVASTSADAIHTSGGVNASGRGHFGGALTAYGATTLSSTLTVSGATTLKSTLTVSGTAQFNGVPKTNKWWYSTGDSGWYNETYSGGIYQTDSDQVRVYGNKVFYNDGFRVWGIGGHHCGLKLYQASHIGINLANSKYTWGIYNNSDGNMYIGRRTGNVNNSTGSYIVTISGTNFTMNGTMTVGGKLTSLGDITSDGNILAKGGMTALTSASDIRLKEQLTTYNALPVINSLRSVAYKWNDTAKNYADVFKTDAIQFGLIAQELQVMFPTFVKNMFDEYLTIDYERLIPIAWRGIQELSEISNKHESRLDKLERENRELKKEVKQLKEKSYGKD